MNVVIYARYSSQNQTEQSIEGQLKECYAFAKKNDYDVIGEYIDRAKSGKKDDREQFLKMIADSERKTFNGIIVYQLDRFARNKYDSVVYKRKLKKNSVRVLSARENISDDASGILMESVLEGMAEYYSVELSQKVKRGLSINAEKCYYNGGTVTLGYKLVEVERQSVSYKSKEVIKKKFVIDEETAPVVRKIFEMYASGDTMADIVKYLNEQNFKTSFKNQFNKNSLRRILLNKKYIGIYTHNGEEKIDGIPRIVDDVLFNRVQEMMFKNKKAPARGKARTEYILTTKLFCGHCKDMMIGYTGTSRTEKVYNYYACKKAIKKACDKKNVRKEYIEDFVAQAAKDMLTNENIDIIAKTITDVVRKEQDTSNLKRLNKLLKENEKQKSNLFDSLKICDIDSVKKGIFEEISKMDIEHKELEKSIINEEKSQIMLTMAEVKFFLKQLQKADITNEINKKALINVFINRVYLYDDKMMIVFNIQNKTVEITISLVNDMESSFMGTSGAPNEHYTNQIYYFVGGFAVLIKL